MLLLALASLAAAAPLELNHQGRLLDAAGAPLTGPHALHFGLYASSQGGSALWTETHDVTLSDGYFAVILGDSAPLDVAWFDDTLYVGLSIDSGAELPRQELGSVPVSLHALVAHGVDGGVVDADELRVGGVLVVDGDGTWQGTLDWAQLDGVPADLADGVVAFDELVDVPADLVDGHVAWDELTSKPPDLADGKVSWDELASKPTALADGAVSWDELTGKPADLADGKVSWDELASKPTALADGQVSWTELTDRPAGFADGVDDVLSEAQVEAYVTNGPIALAAGSTVGGAKAVGANQSCSVGAVVTGIDAAGALTCDSTAFQVTTVAKTADYVVSAAEATGRYAFTNGGAIATVTFTLPAASPGRTVTILRTADHKVRIAAAGGNNIEGSAAFELASRYGGTTLYAIDTSTWVQGSGDAAPEYTDLRAGLTFTPCAASGRFGPSQSQCDAAYTDVPRIHDALSVAAGVQVWTVPVTGSYRIEAWGAEGGGRYYGGTHCTGGLGGYAAGTVALTAGQQIKIVVGQKGGSVDDSTTRGQGDHQGLNGSGGGGTFVTTAANVPLIVAGGGGGRHPTNSFCADATMHGGQTGYTTEGGGGQQDGASGGGGGGFSSNGGGVLSSDNCDPGRSFVAGSQGGLGNQSYAPYTYYQTAEQSAGGFGGGGAARYWSSSAGGGGYHGGQGWDDLTTQTSYSGGTSYVSGGNQTASPGVNTGDGKVVITLQ